MKEHPITFNETMVRAILEGRKTQTRRIIKPQPGIESGQRMHCPYGQVGDRLWVREAWAEEHPLAIQDGRYSQPGRAGIPGPPPVSYRIIYRADGEPLQVWRNGDQSYPYWTRSGPASQIDADFPTVCSNYQRGGQAIYWHPSAHMPRWASRTTLEITGIRVERLNAISEADAKAEGCCARTYRDGRGHEPATVEYRCLWESIYGPGSWDANPYVWVIEFNRINQAGTE